MKEEEEQYEKKQMVGIMRGKWEEMYEGERLAGKRGR